MSKNKNVRLSASRIGTVEKCSWVYWNKYVQGVPDGSNEGASRGSVCHNVFEYLGKDRHQHHLENVLKYKSINGSEALSRLVKIQASKQNPPVNQDVNLDLMDDFIINGLSYDFYGDTEQKPKLAVSEKVFDLEVNEDGKKYHIYGFIDKLFLYDKGKRAVIRDFKTSKKVYAGKEITDNLQNLMYCLAVKKLYPDCKHLSTEFLFLNFDLSPDLLGNPGEGVLKLDPVTDEELEGFEYQLSDVQSYLENFSEETAVSNFASDQPYPTDKSFAGPLSCGFAKFPGQLKKDGTKMWHCHYKFPFDYWVLRSKEGDLLSSALFDEKSFLSPDTAKGEYIEKAHYSGCPKFTNNYEGETKATPCDLDL